MIELKLKDLKRTKDGLFRKNAPQLLHQTPGKIIGIEYNSLEQCLRGHRNLEELGLLITVQCGDEKKYTGFQIQREEDIVYLLNLARARQINALKGAGVTLHHEVDRLYGVSFDQKQSGL